MNAPAHAIVNLLALGRRQTRVEIAAGYAVNLGYVLVVWV